MLCAVQNPATLMTGEADGLVAAQVFYDAFESRYGNGRIGTIMLAALPGSAVFVCAGPRCCWSLAPVCMQPFLVLLISAGMTWG